jgi:hypothetical protein
VYTDMKQQTDTVDVVYRGCIKSVGRLTQISPGK